MYIYIYIYILILGRSSNGLEICLLRAMPRA